MRRFALTLAAVFLCLGSPANLAFAVDYFVNSATGSNSNTGLSDGQAFETIGKALDEAGAGDTVFVRPGNGYDYTLESFPLNVPDGVTIVGDSADTVIVDARTVTDLQFSGCQPAFTVPPVSTDSGNPTVIRDLTIIADTCAERVVEVFLPQPDFEIKGCDIQGAFDGVRFLGPDPIAANLGATYSTSKVVVDSCSITGFLDDGVQWTWTELFSPDVTRHRLWVTDNDIEGTIPALQALSGTSDPYGIDQLFDYQNSELTGVLGQQVTLETIINRNEIRDVQSGGIRMEISAIGSSASISCSAEVKENDVRDIDADGIELRFTAASDAFVFASLSVSSNLVSSVSSTGIRIQARALPPFFTGSVPGNQGVMGIFGASAQVSGTLAHNTTLNNGDDGLKLNVFAGSDFLNVEGGRPVSSPDVANMDMQVLFNDSTGNDSDGFSVNEFEGFGTAHVHGQVIGNYLAGNQDNSVDIYRTFIGGIEGAENLGNGEPPDLGTLSGIGFGRNTFRETPNGETARLGGGPTIYYAHPGTLYAQGNWWGTTDSSEIADLIADGNDYIFALAPGGPEGEFSGTVDFECPLEDPLTFTPSVISGAPGSVAGVTPGTKSNFVGQIGVKDCDEENEGRDMMVTLGGVPVPICNITVQEEEEPLGAFQPGSFLQFIIPFGVPGGPQPLVIMNAGDQMGMTMVTVRRGLGVIDASRCFIATAAFGDENAPAVRVLRRWRDECLSSNALGRQLVKAYYAVSPGLAGTIADSDAARGLTRAMLAPVVGAVKLWLDLPWLYGLAGAALLLRLLRRNRG